MRLLFLIGYFLAFVPNTFTQLKVLDGNENFDNDRNQLSFKFINNNILIPVDLGNELILYFILDTGVKTTIITDPILINILDIPLERSINLRGYGTDAPIPAWVSTKFNYKLNEQYSFTNQDVIILKDAINLDQFLGEPVYGILGYDFLKDHEITISYLRERLLIKTPKNEKKIERLKRKKNVKVYDLEFKGSKPFITTTVSNGEAIDSLKLLVDTGFSGAISLYPNQKTESFLKEPMIRNYQGYGMNGLILSKFIKLESIEMSPKNVLKQVSTQYIDSLSLLNVSHTKLSDGSIGNDILKRFTVSLDYKNEKMYIRPLRSRINKPFRYNKAGIRVLFNFNQILGDHFIIQSVREDSEAYNAGLQHGDVLISINGKSTAKMSLTKVYEALNNYDTDKRELVIKRKNETIDIKFNLAGNIEWN